MDILSGFLDRGATTIEAAKSVGASRSLGMTSESWRSELEAFTSQAASPPVKQAALKRTLQSATEGDDDGDSQATEVDYDDPYINLKGGGGGRPLGGEAVPVKKRSHKKGLGPSHKKKKYPALEVKPPPPAPPLPTRVKGTFTAKEDAIMLRILSSYPKEGHMAEKKVWFRRTATSCWKRSLEDLSKRSGSTSSTSGSDRSGDCNGLP